MCEETKNFRLEPILAGLLFLALSMVTFGSANASSIVWFEPLPWLLLGISLGLWRAHGWARQLAMAVLVGLLAVICWPGGAEWPPVRSLLVEPWVAAELQRHTGLQPTQGGTLLAAALLLWLLSPSVRRAFALAELDVVRDSLRAVSDGEIKDDH